MSVVKRRKILENNVIKLVEEETDLYLGVLEGEEIMHHGIHKNRKIRKNLKKFHMSCYPLDLSLQTRTTGPMFKHKEGSPS